MRICLYTDTALPKMGGQEMVVDALARQYLALGHQPIVFAPQPRKLQTRGECYPYEVARHPRFLSTRLFVGWYRWFLARHYRHRPFDVLHCHGIYPPSYLAALLGDRLPVPVVVTSHGGDVYESNVRIRKPVLRERIAEGLRSADALVAISRFTRDGFTRLCPSAAARIVDIPNGVHLAPYAERAAAPAHLDPAIVPGTYAILVGRLKHRKGVDVLLHALAQLRDTNQVQLVIVGDGEERPTLENLTRQLGLSARVRFVGMMTGADKIYLLQNARFGVVASRQWEAFGLVLLEGYAAGLPMVATDMPGLADLVQPEKTGLLVPPESPDALADAMRRLFADDTLGRSMSANARQFVQDYDWRAVAQRHLDLYERLVAIRTLRAA
jgi:glycogen(starch) synthase